MYATIARKPAKTITPFRRQLRALQGVALALALLGGGGAEVALAQPHHTTAVAWFASHQGFSKEKSKWGINFRPVEPDLATWTSDTTGLYWVDPTFPGADDNGNGYPAAPHKHFPTDAPAGSIIYAAGLDKWDKPDYAIGAAFRVGGSGTYDEPIYVRGDIQGQRVYLGYCLVPVGSYVVVQGFKIGADAATDVRLDAASSGICLLGRIDSLDITNHHLLVRDCEVVRPLPSDHQDNAAPGIAIFGQALSLSFDPETSTNSNEPNYPASNMIVYRCKVHDWGYWNRADNRDRHGIAVAHFSRDVTIMNCELWHCEGNGAQINSSSEYTPANWIQRVFIYRNEAYENQQSALWSKRATDI